MLSNNYMMITFKMIQWGSLTLASFKDNFIITKKSLTEEVEGNY